MKSKLICLLFQQSVFHFKNLKSRNLSCHHKTWIRACSCRVLYFKKTFLITYKLFIAIALIKFVLLKSKWIFAYCPSLYFKKTILITYKLFPAIGLGLDTCGMESFRITQCKLFPAIALIKVCLLEIKVNLCRHKSSLYLKKTFLMIYKLFPAIALFSRNRSEFAQ